MDKLEAKDIKVSRGYTYRYYISSQPTIDPSKPPIVLHHGFPDTSALWTKMLPFLSHLPNRLVIPDLLGYGGTSKPTDPKEYGYDGMTQDILNILDAEGIDKVVTLGHDHGVGSASRFYNHVPDRTVAMILLNVAYSGPNKETPFDLQAINARTKMIFGYPIFEYWNFFTSPEAPGIMEANLDRGWEAAHTSSFEGMRDLFNVQGAFRDYLTNPSTPTIDVADYAKDSELREHWKASMKDGGLTAPLNWYNARVQGVHDEGDKKILDENIKVKVPMLFVGCNGDAVCRKELISLPRDAGLIPDLTVETLDAGHWPMYECPKQLSEVIVRFLKAKELC